MLLKVLSPLRYLSHDIDQDVKESSVHMDVGDSVVQRSSTAVGLRILMEYSNTKRDANVVINSGLKLRKPIFHTMKRSKNSDPHDYCFLKSCFLCNKTLSLDKEVYMYRGDQGFCSVECRSRQIYLDEMREIEISTKLKLASIRRCRDSNWRETSSLLEEYQQRHRPQAMSYQKNPAIFI